MHKPINYGTKCIFILSTWQLLHLKQQFGNSQRSSSDKVTTKLSCIFRTDLRSSLNIKTLGQYPYLRTNKISNSIQNLQENLTGIIIDKSAVFELTMVYNCIYFLANVLCFAASWQTLLLCFANVSNYFTRLLQWKQQQLGIVSLQLTFTFCFREARLLLMLYWSEHIPASHFHKWLHITGWVMKLCIRYTKHTLLKIDDCKMLLISELDSHRCVLPFGVVYIKSDVAKMSCANNGTSKEATHSKIVCHCIYFTGIFNSGRQVLRFDTYNYILNF